MFGGFLLSTFFGNVQIPTIEVVPSRGGQFELKLSSGSTFRTTSQRVSQTSSIRLADGTVLGFWNEGNNPRYAISLDGRTVVRETEFDPLLRLKNFSFDPLKGLPKLSQALATPSSSELFLVQFKSQPLEEYRNQIEAAGGEWYDVVPTNAVICRLPGNALNLVRELPFVRWAGKYEVGYRIEPEILASLKSGKLNTARYEIWCHRRGPEMQDRVGDYVQLLGGKVLQKIPQGFRMTVELSPDQLISVAGLNEVHYIDRHGLPETDMDRVRTHGGANFIETTYGFTGQGVRAEVMDGGLLLNHVAWGTPPIQHPNGIVTDSHGTSTYGIVFGNGASNAAGRGMIPNATGIMASYSLFSGGNRYSHTAELLSPAYQCVFQSNSWGNARVRTYTAISAELDDILFLNDIALLNSQSNAGTQDSRPQAWSKNVISIGAFYHFGNLDENDDRWNSGASIGPAADGRVKPDIAYWYDSILCPTSTSSTAYTTGFGGTSAATPMTAGHFGLFYQMWHNAQFGVPVPANSVFANRPKATLSKAIMINTSNQKTLPAPFDIDRNVQGWGVVNLSNLYNARTKMFLVNETDVLSNLSSKTYKVRIAPGEPAFRATMVYTDPAGTVGAALARKNNLSLKVTGPSGTIWWGNAGMANSNWTQPGGSENNIDTVENVYLPNPAEGVYTVEVIGSDINTDARLETPGVIDADFALCMTGVANPPIAPSTMNVTTGGLPAGNVSDLAHSDNIKLVCGRSLFGSRSLFEGILETTHETGLSGLFGLDVWLERKADFPGCEEKIYVRNQSSQAWDLIYTGTVPDAADTALRVSVPNPANYIAPDGKVQVRCTFSKNDLFLARTSKIDVDYLRVIAQPN